MDGLCKSECGGVYTAFLKAARGQKKGCGAEDLFAEGLEEEHEEEHHHDDQQGHLRSRWLEGGVGEEKKGGEEKGGEEEKKEHFVVVVRGAGDEAMDYLPEDEYPGLMLGCLKDPSDGQYCASKEAEIDEAECDFFMSCCYGELLGGQAKEELVAAIEKKCPGSKAFATKTCGDAATK